jgi:flagellar FliJ protein
MAMFRFRLATLLRLRENARDERRTELAMALRADETLEQQILRIDDELAELLAAAIRSASPGAVNVDLLLEAQRYELVLRAEQAVLQDKRRLLAVEIEKRRDALIAADREVKVLDQFRELQRTRHREEADKRELAEMDAIAINRFEVGGGA